jgi:hypothetical protein
LTTVGWILNTLPRFDVVMRGVPNNFATGSGKRHSRFEAKIPGSVENNSQFFAKPGIMAQAIDRVGVSARILNPWFWSLELGAFRQNRGGDL